MNRYNFVRAQHPTIKAADLNNAKQVNDIAEILNASALIGEYQFIKSEELSAEFSKAASIETEIATRANGSECNRIRVTRPNGKSYLCRAFGSKNALLPPRKWTAEEIKDISAGFCTSDGERVEEVRQSPSGEILALPVIYVKLT